MNGRRREGSDPQTARPLRPPGPVGPVYLPGARAVRLAEGVGDAASALRPQDGNIAAGV